jgi:SpoVK/Ycf46/Vps4 family AAA+-type ATPase
VFRPDAFTYGVLSKDKILGVLLYGPPGTGKTLLAKAVANESHATVLEVTSADLLQCQLGDSEKMVRAIFSLAKKLEPCVIFVDEADSLFFRRSSSDQQHRRTLINQFLREWDGIASGENASGFIMMARNRPSDLDPAVIRRLPRRILVDIPTCAGRKEILNIHLRDEVLGRDCSTADLAEKTPLFSGSDLENLCVAAAFACVYEEEFGSGEMPPAVNGNAGGKRSKKRKKLEETRPRRTLCARHFNKALEEVSASADPSLITSNRRFGKTGLEGANQGGSRDQLGVNYD